MKYSSLICLLIITSLFGCNTQSDENGVALNADTAKKEIPEQTLSDARSEQPTADVEPEPNEETERETVVVEEPETPSPTIEAVSQTEDHTVDAPESTATPLESKNMPPETTTASPTQTATPSVASTNSSDNKGDAPDATGGLPIAKQIQEKIAEKVTELVPVSWIKRLRFWDMANRIIAERNKIPAEFDDAGLKEFAKSLERLQNLHTHMYALQQTLDARKKLSDSKHYDKLMLASLKEEISLPDGTRGRRKKLDSFHSFEKLQKENESIENLQSRLIRDEITKGDLLRLSLQLRENLMHFIEMRDYEIALDEFLMSFPTRASKDFQVVKIWGWYPDVQMTTARELWTQSPPDWFQKDEQRLHKAFNDFVKKERREFLPSQTRSLKRLPDVMTDTEFQKLVKLADRFEELSGGGDRLLIFPKIGSLPSRSGLVEASKRNLAAIKKADAVALNELRSALYAGLSEEKKSRIVKFKGTRDMEIDLINLNYQSSNYDVVVCLDHAIEGELGSAIFYEKVLASEIYDQFYELSQKERLKVFDTGAKYYFKQAKSAKHD